MQFPYHQSSVCVLKDNCNFIFLFHKIYRSKSQVIINKYNKILVVVKDIKIEP
jgi:hypothetical protein